MPRTSSESLTALAIGGPAAGLTLRGEHGATRYFAPQPIELDYMIRREVQNISVSIEHHFYLEHTFTWQNADRTRTKIQLWIWDKLQAETLPELIKVLLEGYHPLVMQILPKSR